MKRILGLSAAAGLILFMLPTAQAVGTSASSAIVMEKETGQILYEHNAREPRLIASITKLMTALVALESGHDLQETVTIDPAWAGAEGSSIYLQAGEQVTLETLLYGMLLRSGNDAALAVAGHCGGSVEHFVEQMNRKAKELGMENSSFANPNGLNDEDHYSTAYDMALLARACLEQEQLAEMVATKSITLGTRTFTNHNKLLWRYKGCIGMKTGYTEKAGRTLVSAAQREGMTLICVTLNAPDDWTDHTTLFDYGFQEYRLERLGDAGGTVCTVPVRNSLLSFCPVVLGEERFVCLKKDERVDREVRLDVTSLDAPLSAGQKVGQIIYRTEGRELCSLPLVTGVSVGCDAAEDDGIWGRLFS